MAPNYKIIVKVDNTDEVMRELNDRIDKALTAAAMQAESYAKLELENDPRRIDTGLLRNSITHGLWGEAPAIRSYKGDRASRYYPDKGIPSGTYSGSFDGDRAGVRTAYVGTNVEYAIYVHEGGTLPRGGKMKPNHFLKNAMQKNKEQLSEMLRKYLKGVF